MEYHVYYALLSEGYSFYEALERAKERSELDRFESEPEDFHNRIRDSYLEQASKNDRFKIVNSSKEIESVAEQVINYVNEFLDE